MNLAIVGSRDFDDYEFLKKMIDHHPGIEYCSKIISGGARGADTLAHRYAIDRGIPFKEFPPNFDAYGMGSFFRRNAQIAEACDELVAFWDKKSTGTEHCFGLAEAANKPVYKYWPPPKELMEGIGI